MKIKCACGSKDCDNVIWNEGSNRLFIRKGNIIDGTDILIYLNSKAILSLMMTLSGMLIHSTWNKLNEILNTDRFKRGKK